MQRLKGTVIAASVLAGLLYGHAAEAAEGSVDYSVTTQSNLYEYPPANATQVSLVSPYYARQVSLPFSFQYWGTFYSSLWATNAGYVQFGVTQGQSQSSDGLLADVFSGSDKDGLC